MGTLVLEDRQGRQLDHDVKIWSCGVDYGTDPFFSSEKAHVAATKKVLGTVDAGQHEEEVCRGAG